MNRGSSKGKGLGAPVVAIFVAILILVALFVYASFSASHVRSTSSPVVAASTIQNQSSISSWSSYSTSASATPVRTSNSSSSVGSLRFNSTQILLASNPGAPVYDAANGYLYMPSTQPPPASAGEYAPGNATLSVLSTSTNKVIAVLRLGDLGSDPLRPMLDPANGEVYVSVTCSPSPIPCSSNSFPQSYLTSIVAIISGKTLISTVRVGSYPTTPILDTQNGDIYVPNYHSNYTSVISGATNMLVANVSVIPGVNGGVFDPANGDIYLTDSRPCDNGCVVGGIPGYVLVVSPDTNAVVGNITLNFEYPSRFAPLPLTNEFQSFDAPSVPAFDPANGDIYVSNNGGNTTSVISGVTNSLIANVVVGDNPGTPVVDSANGDVYVPTAGGVSVISGTTNALITTIKVSAVQATFNPRNGDIYVTSNTEDTCQAGACLVNSTVSIISGATNTVAATVPLCLFPRGTSVDTSNGDVYVSCQSALWEISSTTSPSSTRLGEIIPDCSTLMNVLLNPAPTGAVYIKVVNDQGSTDVTNGTVIVVQSGSFGSLHYCLNMSDVNGSGYLQLAPLYFNGTAGYESGYYNVTLWVGYDNPNATNNPGPSYWGTISSIQIQPYSTIYITAFIPSGAVTMVTSGEGNGIVTTTTTSATTDRLSVPFPLMREGARASQQFG
jgi:YVTN family beta-propeller protein